MSTTPEAPPPAPPPPAAPASEDRTVAILAYITLIGFIVAIVMHGSNKTKLGAFHLRQVLGLFVTGIGLMVPCFIIALIPVVNLLMLVVWPVLGLTLFVFVLLGFIAAASGQQKPVPVLGEHYQKWFANAFT